MIHAFFLTSLFATHSTLISSLCQKTYETLGTLTQVSQKAMILVKWLGGLLFIGCNNFSKICILQKLTIQ